jgi:hypothetical protein
VLLAFTTTEKVNIALAIASGGVAIATGYLAFKTRGMANETQRWQWRRKRRRRRSLTKRRPPRNR